MIYFFLQAFSSVFQHIQQSMGCVTTITTTNEFQRSFPIDIISHPSIKHSNKNQQSPLKVIQVQTISLSPQKIVSKRESPEPRPDSKVLLASIKSIRIVPAQKENMTIDAFPTLPESTQIAIKNKQNRIRPKRAKKQVDPLQRELKRLYGV